MYALMMDPPYPNQIVVYTKLQVVRPGCFLVQFPGLVSAQIYTA
jgi:hypothetical protein